VPSDDAASDPLKLVLAEHAILVAIEPVERAGIPRPFALRDRAVLVLVETRKALLNPLRDAGPRLMPARLSRRLCGCGRRRQAGQCDRGDRRSQYEHFHEASVSLLRHRKLAQGYISSDR
jgi:hypothetical protein